MGAARNPLTARCYLQSLVLINLSIGNPPPDLVAGRLFACTEAGGGLDVGMKVLGVGRELGGRGC